jgi:hypothetical protein
VGIFDDFNQEEKIRTITIEINTSQMAFYALLMQVGIDPDSFDESHWEEPLNMETPIGRVRHYIDLLAALRAKKEELQNQA